jgi:rubrerythrin
VSDKTRQDVVALRMAIQTEVDGYEFYTRAAEQAHHPRTKALFQTVAKDELVHREWLEAQQTSLQEDGHWLPEAQQKMPQMRDVTQGLPIFVEDHIIDITEHTSELTALRTAVLIEQDAVNFYERAAGQTDDLVGKDMYRFLADFEREHRRVLEEEYTFLMGAFRGAMGFAPF